MIKLAFLVVSSLFLISIFLGTFLLYDSKNFSIKNCSVAISVVLMIIYCSICAVSLLFVSPIAKVVMLLCGFSPFIIGRFVTYKKLLLFNFIQMFIITAGILYTMLIGLH